MGTEDPDVLAEGTDPEMEGTADTEQQEPAPQEGTTGEGEDSAKFFQTKYQQERARTKELEEKVTELSAKLDTLQSLLGDFEEAERELEGETAAPEGQATQQPTTTAVDWKQWAYDNALQAWKDGNFELFNAIRERFADELRDTPLSAVIAQQSAQQQQPANQEQAVDPVKMVLRLRRVEQQVSQLAGAYGKEFLDQQVVYNGETVSRAEAITMESLARGEDPNAVALRLFPQDAQKALVEQARRSVSTGMAGALQGAPSPGGQPGAQQGPDQADMLLSDSLLSTKPPEGTKEPPEVFLGGGAV